MISRVNQITLVASWDNSCGFLLCIYQVIKIIPASKMPGARHFSRTCITNKGESISSKTVTPTTSHMKNKLKLDINALTRISWLHDRHIDLAFDNLQKN